MLKKLFAAFFWLCLMGVPTSDLSGQFFSHQLNLKDSTQVHILRSQRGDRFVGQLKDIRSTTIYFRLNNGDELSFDFHEVISVVTWEEEKTKGTPSWQRSLRQRGGIFLDSEKSIGAENLIYSSTAFNYEKLRGEVRSFSFLINVIDIGIAEGVSLGGGFSLPDIGIFRTKITTPISENSHIGVGSNLIFPISDFSNISGLAHTYLVLTRGNKDRYLNFTAGAFISFDSFNDHLFIASLGGAYRVSPRWRMHFEFFFGAEEGAFIPGIGAIWQKGNFKLEFGLVGAPAIDLESILIPIFALGFVF